MYLGAFGYADDLILLGPSKKGLQSMVNICYEFGKEYDVSFKDKKTVCIGFGTNHYGKILLGIKELK